MLLVMYSNSQKARCHNITESGYSFEPNSNLSDLSSKTSENSNHSHLPEPSQGAPTTSTTSIFRRHNTGNAYFSLFRGEAHFTLKNFTPK